MLDLPWYDVQLCAGGAVTARVMGWYGPRWLAATLHARFTADRASVVVRSARGSQWAACLMPGPGLLLAPMLLTWGRFRSVPASLAAFTIGDLVKTSAID